MTQKTDFEAIKAEILNRAEAAKACAEQYSRAYKSETLQELCSVIKDNFHWCFNNKVITSDLLIQYRKDFAQNDIFINISVRSGFLLCDNATVEAYGNATVEAWDNATVEAYDNATVEAWDNATVKAWDNATVKAYGNATVEACDNATVEACDNAYCTSHRIIECKLSNNAIYRVKSTNTVYYSSDSINFIKQ